MMLYAFVPIEYMDLVITLFALALAIWVCMWRFYKRSDGILYLRAIGAVWFLIAFSFDYLFLVQAFSVQNYYDFDILLYYLSTLLLPLIIGRWERLTAKALV